MQTVTEWASSAFLSTLSLRRATIMAQDSLKGYPLFLSTLSLRRATYRYCWERRLDKHFYPRSPCGERPQWFFLRVGGIYISIHALLAESDCVTLSALAPEEFLSTLSLRRATVTRVARTPTTVISIHALLAESDRMLCR